MMILPLAALALAQAVPNSTLPTVAVADAQDARCIVVLGYVGSRGAPGSQDFAKRGIFYFVGRLSGRNPTLDVARAIVLASDEARVAKINAQAELARCTSDLDRAQIALNGVRGAVLGSRSAPTPRTP